MIERDNPLFAVTQVTRKEPSKHVSHNTNFNVEDETNRERTGQPVVCRDTSHAQGAFQTRFSQYELQC